MGAANARATGTPNDRFNEQYEKSSDVHANWKACTNLNCQDVSYKEYPSDLRAHIEQLRHPHYRPREEFSRLHSEGTYDDDMEILTQEFDLRSASGQSVRSDRTSRSAIWSELSGVGTSAASMRSAELHNRLAAWQQSEHEKSQFLRDMKAHYVPDDRGPTEMYDPYNQRSTTGADRWADDRYGDDMASQRSYGSSRVSESRMPRERRRDDFAFPEPEKYHEFNVPTAHHEPHKMGGTRPAHYTPPTATKGDYRMHQQFHGEEDDHAQHWEAPTYQRRNAAISHDQSAMPEPVTEAPAPRHVPAAPGPSEFEDVSAKLRTAQRQVADVQAKLKAEQEKSEELRKQLTQQKSAGNELEVQLMTKFVAMKERYQTMEIGKTKEEQKAWELNKNLDDEKERRTTAEADAAEQRKEKFDLKAGLDLAKSKAQENEAKAKEKENETKALQKGMDDIKVERDETLKVLERAVQQNQDLKAKVREMEKSGMESKEELKHEQKEERAEIRNLLHKIDKLLAMAGRSSDANDPTAQGLFEIREGLRHFYDRIAPGQADKKATKKPSQ